MNYPEWSKYTEDEGDYIKSYEYDEET